MIIKTQAEFKNKTASQSGLSLIEICLCMVLIGLLMTSGIQMYNNYRKDLEVSGETILRERVTSAMAMYVEKNNRYPCPANAALNPDDAGFGKETDGCASAPAAATGVLQGMVPVYELNLPYRLAADVYGRKMTYAVTETLTKTNGLSKNAAISIKNNNGTVSSVPFVIVYHGPDGKGARPLLSSGAVSSCAGTAADVENCNGDEKFNDFMYAPLSDASSSNYFDDDLVFSLATKETSVWATSPTDTGVAIGNKNNANVGIGVTTPQDKLHVRGDLQVDSSSDSVNVNASGNINAAEIRSEQNIEAGTDMEGKRINAPIFTYN